MTVTKRGFERYLAYGVAGVQAATQITNLVDVQYNTDPEKAEDTIGGDGSTVPINTETVVALSAELTFNMRNKPSDTTLAALIAAARTGTPVALYYKDHASGKGYDGDVTLAVTNGAELKGVGTFDFTATPYGGNRTPNLNAA